MNVGDSLPIFVQMNDYSTGRFVRAFVRNASGNPIVGSPVNLSAIDSSGGYGDSSLVMPNTPWVYAIYLVYTDGTYTVLSSVEGGSSETFFLSANVVTPNFPPTSNIIGVVDSESCNPLPIQDTITQGSDRTLTVRLVESLSGNPFDLTGATLIEFRFRRTDGTILSVKTTDAGPPVEVISAEAGKLLCLLTAAQTLLLSPTIPAPFSIVVTQPVAVTVVNLPTQIAVEEQDV